MATSYYLSPFASFLQVLNDSGQLQTGLLMWTYLAGTTTPTMTWTDITGTVPNSNPIVLNAAGRLPNVSVWQQAGVAIKVIFSTNAGTTGSPAFGTQIGPTFDQVTGIDDPTGVLTTLASNASGSGADLVANAVRGYDLVGSVRAANVPSPSPGATLIINVQGGTVTNDGFGGSFYWSASSTATDDGGITTIKPTAASGAGRYLRLLYSSSGSFTGTWPNLSGAPTATVQYTWVGSLVTLVLPAITGTQTGSPAHQIMTGLPSYLTPVRTQYMATYGGGNGNSTNVGVVPFINTNGSLQFYTVTSSSWILGEVWLGSTTTILPQMTLTFRLL